MLVTLTVAVLAGLAAGLAGTPALRGRSCSGTQCRADAALPVITSDAYFYGQSPPVYPSPNMTGQGGWADAFARARVLVGEMTLEEKISLTGGVEMDNACSGNVPPIPRLGFPGLCLSDARNGVRSTDFVSSWPSGVHVGASWNKELAAQRGAGMGLEFRAKGVNVLLGPVVGPLGGIARGGRSWEGFSADPYLAGSLAYETVRAIQGVGVITSTKHYIANEQESYRSPSGGIEAVSANIDDQSMHESYLWPFQDAVDAGTGSIMCSYNRINNSYGCANSKSLNGLLKTELGFQGFVVSDWGAQHAGVATALAGLDMVMPNGSPFWAANLSRAVRNGSVPESRVTDMATRITASWYRMGQDRDFPPPGIGMPADLTKPHEIVDARNASYRPVLFVAAVEGHVLLKNTNDTLPLHKPALLSVFGFSAKAPDQNNIGTTSWIIGNESFSGLYPAIAINGTVVSGGGSGATAQSRIVSPFDSIVHHAYQDDTALFWNFTTAAPHVHPASAACLVLANAFASEGRDRPALRDAYTDALVSHVAARCARTVVVLHSPGPRLLDPWIDHPNVSAVLLAHLPGQDSGPALAALLYGAASPSGKLPYAVPRHEPGPAPAQPAGAFVRFPQSDLSAAAAGHGAVPRFPLGFGLAYTTFSYADLTVVAAGGLRVAATVANVGGREGAEVAQLWVDDGGGMRLRGFEKVALSAGEAARVEFEVGKRGLGRWDVRTQGWVVRRGKWRVEVGGGGAGGEGAVRGSVMM